LRRPTLRLLRPACALLAGAVLLAAAAAHAQSSTPRTETWVTTGIATGSVYAIATTPTTVYLGGFFTYVGPQTGYGAPLSTADPGSVAGAFPQANGTIYACVSDGAGGWYIGGDFTLVGSLTRNRLARVLADGTVDATWNPNANNTVRALALAGTTVYAGGAFTNGGSTTRNRIAAFDASTGAVTTWNPNANNTVYALTVSGTTVYAGGDFTTIGGQTRGRAAGLSTSTGLATAWNPSAGSTVRALATSVTAVYAGGDFTTIGGATRNRIAALNTGNGLATTWNPSADNTVHALKVSGTTVFAGGSFSLIGGQTRNRIAAVSTSTGLATAWVANAGSTVYALEVSGTAVYAGGDFASIGGQNRCRLAKLDATSGTPVATWDRGTGARVYALGLNSTGTHIYVGTSSPSVGGVPRAYLAALDRATGEPTAWNPSASGLVRALAVSDTTVYAGGDFTSVGGQTRNRIAALDATTGAVMAWDPNASARLYAVAVAGTTVYAGGDFTTIGGQTRNRIAALDAGTGLATAWNPNADSTVKALAVSGTTVYAGGYFGNIGGATRPRIGALSADTGLATAWNPNADSFVYTLAVSGTTVYIGGVFTSVGGLARNRIAALNAGTGLATTWNPNANEAVYTVAVSGTTVYAGGDFSTIGGQSRMRLAALEASTGAATAWSPNASAIAQALAVEGSSVYAGGDFTNLSYGGQPRNHFAQFDRPVPAAPTNPGATAIGTDTITWTWQDNSSDETGFKVYDDPGAGPPPTLRTTTAAGAVSWQHAGLAVNTQHAFQVAATNVDGDSAKTSTFAAWTLANPPTAPGVSDPTAGSLVVTLGASDGNPPTTEYAIQVTPTVGGNPWVQAGGTVGAAAVWQTAAAWGAKTVTGLAGSETYTFAVQARNGAAVATAFGPGTSGTTAGTAAPTVLSFSPADNATGVAVAANLVILFDQTVVKGTGLVEIRRAADEALVESFDVAASPRVVLSQTSQANDTVTIDPSADLPGHKSFYVQIGAACFADLSENAFAGIADSTTWNFETLNRAPAAGDDTATVDEDSSAAAIDVLANDTEPDGETLTIISVTQGTHGGSVAITGAGSGLTYQPAADYNGSETFTYTVNDGTPGSEETATVSVTVNPLNDPPVNTTAPLATGTAAVGEVLTVAPGVWNDAKDGNPGAPGLSYQWRRAADASGTGAADIAGATGTTYTLSSDDGGRYVCVVEAATDTGTPGSATASAASAWRLVALYHPQDADRDWALSQAEVQAVRAAWAGGSAPNPDPDFFMLRSIDINKADGYHYDPLQTDHRVWQPGAP
jgi:hypothetical protein